MILAEIIKSKVDDLYKTYNNLNFEANKEKIESLKEDINKLATLIETISKDIKNIKDISYQDISKYISINEVDLKNIQLVLKAKYEFNLSVDLTTTQLEVIKKILEELVEKKNILTETIKKEEEIVSKNKEESSSIEDNILNLEYLYEKVNNPEDYSLLNLEDFETLSIIFEDKDTSSKVKIDLLSSVIEYNETIEKQNKKILSTTDIEEVKECFRSFDFKEDMLKFIDRNKEEISRNIDLSNTREILTFLQSKNILDKFSKGALLAIVLYSNESTVSKRYEDLKERKALLTPLFEIPSIWVNNLPKKVRVRHKSSSKNKGENNNYNRLRGYASKISYEEMISNEQYLTSMGLNVSISDKTNIKVLETPREKIDENLNSYKLYGFFDSRDMSTLPPSMFSFSKVADKCDKLIEIGLLHNTNNNYTITFPTIINTMREENFALLSKLKRENNKDEYYNLVFSQYYKRNIQSLNRCLTTKCSKKFGYNLGTIEEIETFKQENFMDQTDNKYIPNASKYEEILTKENPITYQDAILTDEKIRVLEEQYRVDNNPYQYKIGNEIISRLKVLRCYSSLKEKGISDDNALLYSVTRGMYLDEKTFNMLKIAVKGRGEYINGLSNKI